MVPGARWRRAEARARAAAEPLQVQQAARALGQREQALRLLEGRRPRGRGVKTSWPTTSWVAQVQDRLVEGDDLPPADDLVQALGAPVLVARALAQGS